MGFFRRTCFDEQLTVVFCLRVLTVIGCLLGACTELCGQSDEPLYRVRFVDKGSTSFAPGAALYETTLASFHPEAIQRRVLIGMDPVLDSLDKPINQQYLDVLELLGIKPALLLTWSNAVIAQMTDVQRTVLQNLPFVASVNAVSKLKYEPLMDAMDCSPQRPGNSQLAHDIINITPLHDAGVLGSNIRFGLIDCGFHWEDMSSLQHIRVDATYDFVHNDSIVRNQPGEPTSQEGHGSIVLSVAAGWLQDSLIGMAPLATYLLAKTENLEYERRIEEEAYCAAVEWLERKGAWVLSSSVGYWQFDSTEEPADWSVMTGSTTWASQYVNRATKLGMLAAVAAGNSGPEEHTIIIPAEADSAITVGACTPLREAWHSSSVGPTASGKVKPNVGCLGVQVQSQAPNGELKQIAGTSLATPQIGGSLAVLRELFPDAPTYEIRRTLYASCTMPSQTGQALGHGIPNITTSARLLGSVLKPGIGPIATIGDGSQAQVLTTVYSASELRVVLVVMQEDGTDTIVGEALDSLWYRFTIPADLFTGDSISCYVLASNVHGDRRAPAQPTVLTVRRTTTIIPCGMRLPAGVVGVAATTFPSVDRKGWIAPNPSLASGIITIQGLSTHGTIHLIHTSTGQFVATLSPLPTPDGWRVMLPSLASGHYLVVQTSRDGVLTIPLLIQE